MNKKGQPQNIGKIIALGIAIFVILLIASAGAFSDIIKSFTEAMGGYGLILGILIVLIIIVAIINVALGNRR